MIRIHMLPLLLLRASVCACVRPCAHARVCVCVCVCALVLGGGLACSGDMVGGAAPGSDIRGGTNTLCTVPAQPTTTVPHYMIIS